MVLWALLTSTGSHNEVITGLGVSALVAAVAIAMEVSERAADAPLVRSLPHRVLVDTVKLAGALGRRLRGTRVPGRWTRIELPPKSNAAAVTVVVSVSPNTIVADATTRTATTHEVAPSGARSLDDVLGGE
jgi:hypothetical protein